MNMKEILVTALIFLPVIINAQEREIVAFFPEWRAKGEHPYYVKDIEERNSAGKITVLNYAFLIPEPDSSGKIIPAFMNPQMAYQQWYSTSMSIDGIADDSTQPLKGQFNQLKKLKQKHPGLKILLSIGGWEGSTYFSDAALTPESREYFVNICIDRFIHGNLPLENGAGGKGAAAGIFDGFDIDWEYPVNGGVDSIHHHPDDNNNLSKLLELFRTKLDRINSGYLLTETVPPTEKYARYYNLYDDQRNVDWYNLMTYDYRGGWDPYTGHNSNLLSSSVDTTFDRERNSLDKTIKLFNCIYGLSRSKLVPGTAFYGRGWKNVDSLNNGLGMKGAAAIDSTSDSYRDYAGLVHLSENGYKLFWDDYTLAPYLYNPEKKIFWTFDNPKSIALKAHYVKAYELRGLMFWEISGDDSLGTLVDVIYNSNMQDVNIPVSTQKVPPPEFEIINPVSSDWIIEGTNVLIKTKSSGNDSGIIKVIFYGDGKSLGYCTQQPFDWAWFNVPEGSHTITSAAYYSSGTSAASASVTINVRKK
jgi:chitinase